MLDSLRNRPGSQKLNHPLVWPIIIAIGILISYFIAKGSIRAGIMFAALFPLIFYMNRFFSNPIIGLYTLIALGFLAIGVTRYVIGIPLGLSIDGFLVLTFIAYFFKTFYEGGDYHKIKSDIVLLMFIWFLYGVAQLFNPEALSQQAWFYAMRGSNLYSFLAVPVALLVFSKPKHLNTFLYIWAGFSILGSLKGFQQLYIGPDFAEQRWLDAGGAVTHILFGELRVFSFYSDAGQFGAAQGSAGVVGILVAMNSKNFFEKGLFYTMGFMGLWGMMISGTRGAIVVPMAGFMMYMIHRKNVRVIIIGAVFLALVYVFFKYTYIGQGNYQVRRMRTAFRPEEDASLQVRLENRRILSVYLATRPIGGGIGSAGMWGQRFSPQGFLANVATDSWYVQIWAEQGIIGLALHLFILSYILVKGSYLIMFYVRDPELRGKLSAITGAYAGVLAASYGNGVLGQMPTGILTYFTWAFMWQAIDLDDQVMAMKKPQTTRFKFLKDRLI